ncbi:MAG: hypothetical protein KDJ37_16055 [Hyphomicrobiaceae bacterium]|nr:hypothetical protein [Hyphomicrobiaceae bacterium]
MPAALVQLDQVLGLSALAVDTFANSFDLAVRFISRKSVDVAPDDQIRPAGGNVVDLIEAPKRSERQLARKSTGTNDSKSSKDQTAAQSKARRKAGRQAMRCFESSIFIAEALRVRASVRRLREKRAITPCGWAASGRHASDGKTRAS